jgi:hypothetical protein
MPAANTNISLGVLNRLRTSVSFPTFPQFNISASFLGRRSVRLTRDGRIVENLDALTGIVPSPEPYQKMAAHINLLKSQGLANAFEQQLQSQPTLGQMIVRTDTGTLQQYVILNSSIITVEELSFAGDTPDFMITIEGYYPVSSFLYAS